MDEFRTDTSKFSPSDFLLWQANGLLEITPKFQRRSVWRTPARAYFIDTMLRGMTVPPLYFRLTQNESKTKQIREVVDGQQRVRCVLDFIADEFRLSKPKSKSKSDPPWTGKLFSQLSSDHQQQIRTFAFPTETFKGISDKQILEVFCRLNTYGVGLNSQELRNGKFFGAFKNTSYDLALSYLEFWRKHRLFTEIGIARMLEVELTSELLIAGNSGMQDKKKSIDTFYELWEDAYPGEQRDTKRFTETLNTISETFTENELRDSVYRRPPLFYSLYCVVFHHTFGLPGIQRATPGKRLTADERRALRDAVSFLSDKVVESKDPAVETPTKYKAFIAACARQTDNIQPRKIMFNTLYDVAF